MCGENPLVGWKQLTAEGSFPVGVGLSLPLPTQSTVSDERPKVSWLPTKKPDLTKPKPKVGTVQLEWNKTGSLLLARYGQ